MGSVAEEINRELLENPDHLNEVFEKIDAADQLQRLEAA